MAIPFGFWMFGYDTILHIPVVGFDLNLGWLIILVVPIAITSAANSANMLEGFNGLGAT